MTEHCSACGKQLMSAFRGTKQVSKKCRPCWEKEWNTKRRLATL